MKSLVSIFLFMLVVIVAVRSNNAHADEQMAVMTAGEEAPFDGTLFNVEAAARILSELKFSKETCEIESSRAIELQAAQYDLKIDRLQASYDSLKFKHEELIKIKDGQIQFYEKELLRPRMSGNAWFAIGVGSGVLLTVASGYALNQASTR